MSNDVGNFFERILDKRELSTFVPFAPQHIQRLENMGYFPHRIKVGPGRVGWLLSEVLAWIEERKKERNLGLAPFSLANWGIPDNKGDDDPDHPHGPF